MYRLKSLRETLVGIRLETNEDITVLRWVSIATYSLTEEAQLRHRNSLITETVAGRPGCPQQVFIV